MFTCVTYYSAVFPFVSQGTEYFRVYKGVTDANDARQYSSYPVTVACYGWALATGLIIDKTGHHVLWTMFGIFLTGLSHFIFISVDGCPAFLGYDLCFYSSIMIGIGYSFVASGLWPMLSFNVDQSISSTAYGLMQSIQQLGLSLVLPFCGYTLDSYPNETKVLGYESIAKLYFLCSLLAFSLCSALVFTVGTHGVPK